MTLVERTFMRALSRVMAKLGPPASYAYSQEERIEALIFGSYRPRLWTEEDAA